MRPLLPPSHRPLLQRATGPAGRLAALVLLVLLAGSACSRASAGDEGGDLAAAGAPTTVATQEGSGDEASDPELGAQLDEAGSGEGSSLADLITALPPAPTGLPTAVEPGPRPVSLTISDIGVEVATVIGVGVEPNGDMEIPPADEVGWYRYGPAPGEKGSAVLAAHIAYDGQNGVFVQLDDLEIGSSIQVAYEDGTTTEFVAVALEQYDKQELPKQEIFDRTGRARLVLITCGGEFNRSLRSYEDNIVVYAEAAAVA